MELFNTENYTWTHFGITALFFVGLYFLVRIVAYLARSTSIFGRYSQLVMQITWQIKTVFEVIVFLALTAAFILVNPIRHGIIVILGVVFFISHIRNYFTGSMLQLNAHFKEGRKIEVDTLKGILYDINRFHVLIKTNDGLHIRSYKQLYDSGLKFVSGDHVGGFYELIVQPIKEPTKQGHRMDVMDFLAESPYIDWKHTPLVSIHNKEMKTYKLTVLVREEKHLTALMSTLESQGYQSQILKK